MSETIKSAIASEIAKLTQVVSFPEAPFGYGTDISCATDLEDDVRDVDGRTTLALAQAVYRRLTCPRGALPDDPDYGIDLPGYANRGTTAAEVRSLAGQIRAELGKDDRIENTIVTVRPDNNARTLRIEIAIAPYDPELEPFSLTLNASDAGVLIEEISGG